VKRQLEIKSDSPWFVLSGDGPDTGFTHFCAFQSADALGVQFVEELRRKGITTPRTAEAVFRSAFIHEASSRLNDLVR
jgi:hypothetical protein